MFSAYRQFISENDLEELRSLASKLAGIRILHISSSRIGGGVAEILKRSLPLLEEGGAKARWETIMGSEEYLGVTKDIHRGLQGTEVSISKEQWELYKQEVEEWVHSVDINADIVVVHDPQPLPAILRRDRAAKWVWRCHIDLSAPDKKVLNHLKKYVTSYDASVFSLSAFAPSLLKHEFIISPSIDPLSHKNICLTEAELEKVRLKYNIGEKPLIAQISRFDHFKDPIGVVKAYHLVKERVDCQLALVSGPAEDDPEQTQVISEVRNIIGDDRDVKMLFLPPNCDREINAIQTIADVIVQKSIKEGFGLPVAEAMWKRKAVVGGRTGGIILQIEDSVNGFIVNSVNEAAQRIDFLLSNTKVRERMGAAAKESVRSKFLITRELRDHYLMVAKLMNIT